MKDRILAVLPWALVLVGFIIAYSFISNVGKTSKENNVYVRYTACILSIKPSARGDKEINGCWDRVTTEAKFSPQRYDTQGF